MIRRGKVLSAVLLAAAWAVGDGARAQSADANVPVEKNSAAKSEVPAGSIDGAKKDFEAVKSLRNIGSAPSGAMPQMALPKIRTEGSADLAPMMPAKRTPDGEKRSSSWLVDAMEKRAAPRMQRGTEGKDFDRRDEPGDRRNEARGIEAEKERMDRTNAVNPFATYLGEWMTPQDYSLLKPAIGHPAYTESVRPNSSATGAFSDPIRIESEPVLAVPGSNSAMAIRRTAPGGERENPYLEALGAIGSVSGGPAVGVKPISAPAASTLPVGPAPVQQAAPAVPQSRVPDFVRPNANDKYFKQLKRF